MADIALLSIDGTTNSDIFIDTPYLLSGYELETAVNISLNTKRRANPDDILLDNQLRGGWWADSYSTIPNDKIGSRLWLLSRLKMTQNTLTLAREYALESLRWLIDDKIASNIDCDAEFLGIDKIALSIAIQKPQGTDTFNFSFVWKNL